MSKKNYKQKLHFKNWVEAIEETIKTHEYAIAIKVDYISAKKKSNKSTEIYNCPLCRHSKYVNRKNNKPVHICDVCIWMKYTDKTCVDSVNNKKLSYHNNEASIIRLNEWKEQELINPSEDV